jgi:hypothetical protein
VRRAVFISEDALTKGVRRALLFTGDAAAAAVAQGEAFRAEFDRIRRTATTDFDDKAKQFSVLNKKADVWNEDYTQRSIHELKLTEGSIVWRGASPTTTGAVRSLADVLDMFPDDGEYDENEVRRVLQHLERLLPAQEIAISPTGVVRYFLEVSLNGYADERTSSTVRLPPSFTYVDAVVSRVHPFGGPVMGGTMLTLRGRNLGDYGGLSCRFAFATLPSVGTTAAADVISSATVIESGDGAGGRGRGHVKQPAGVAALELRVRRQRRPGGRRRAQHARPPDRLLVHPPVHRRRRRRRRGVRRQGHDLRPPRRPQ